MSKLRILLSVLLGVVSWANILGQTSSRISSQDSIKIENQVAEKISTLKKELSGKEYQSDYYKKRIIEFTIDTFKIERRKELQLEINSTTHGYLDAIYRARYEYDLLLNKYYKLLMDKLQPTDRENLKTAQRHWIKFRDANSKFNWKSLEGDGGSIVPIIAASHDLKVLSKRVYELHEFIIRQIAITKMINKTWEIESLVHNIFK